MVIGNGQLVEAGDPVQAGPIRTGNSGMGFYGFYRPDGMTGIMLPPARPPAGITAAVAAIAPARSRVRTTEPGLPLELRDRCARTPLRRPAAR